MKRAAAVLALCGLLAGCGGGDARDDDAPLTVFAAASLREVLPEIDGSATYVFAGSNQLAVQLRDGARADVFVSASERVAAELVDAGVVEPPVTVASNRLVVVVPRASSAVAALDDLDDPGVKLVLGAVGVPAGDYAREALPAAGLEGALANVVSLEDDVRGVVAKVALGEADAGVVYATDARVASDRLRVLPLSDTAQPRIAYSAAVVDGTRFEDRARAYVDRLLGPEGNAALKAAGFLPPSS